jgi:hypothetical protein
MPFISTIRSVYGPIGRMGRIIGAKDAITGGTISSAGGYRIHTFTDVGTSQFNMSMVASALNIEYLIIAGGGGGSGEYSGGGGAGGYRTGTISSGPANYPIAVGMGGAGGAYGFNGGNSSFNGVISTGGGSSGGPAPSSNAGPSGPEVLPQSGGSGAGGAVFGDPPYKSPGSGTSGQGFSGGTALSTYGVPAGTSWPAAYYTNGDGGGGGAGGVGGNASRNTGYIQNGSGGAGGAGMSSSITGSSITRASGGGGSGRREYWGGDSIEPYQAPTPGGGGRGWSANRHDNWPPGQTGGAIYYAEAGTPNTGGGGGSGYSGYGGGMGGSGIVIVRYTFP